MGPLFSREHDRSGGVLRSRGSCCHGESDGLGVQEPNECPSGGRPTPIPPQDRLGWGNQWERCLSWWGWPFNWPQHSAHATRSLGLVSISQTVLSQLTPTTIGQPCCIEQTYRAIMLWAACFCIKRVPCRTAQRAIRLRLEGGGSELSCSGGPRKIGRPVENRSGWGDGEMTRIGLVTSLMPSILL